MPDPERKTISATQAPALFNASPYTTRWMLYHYLRGNNVEPAPTSRMSWGTKLQPLILEQAQADLKLDITPNFSHSYVRSQHGALGYTADATVWCPDRGRGTVEAKCCFDMATYMQVWGGGERPPRHVELQLQQQLTVGDGAMPFAWGVIALWVCGEMKYFERTRDDKVSESLITQALAMLADVEHAREPEPFGSSAELPILATLFPVVKGKELDLRKHEHGAAIAQMAADYKNWKSQENFFQKAAGDARAKLLAIAKDAETVLLPGAALTLSSRHVKEHMRKASTSTTLKVTLENDNGRQPENEN